MVPQAYNLQSFPAPPIQEDLQTVGDIIDQWPFSHAVEEQALKLLPEELGLYNNPAYGDDVRLSLRLMPGFWGAIAADRELCFWMLSRQASSWLEDPAHAPHLLHWGPAAFHGSLLMAAAYRRHWILLGLRVHGGISAMYRL